MSQWNRERTRALLRYARKQCGPWDWDEHDTPEWRDGDIPDDDDVDLVTQAPAMLELLKRIAQWDMLGAVEDGPYWKQEIEAIIRKATGDE